MKPISLRFKCFGPFMEEQFIDFEDLRSFGLFLITGSTGAGKTTILDAMCMALYGQSSGGKRGELADMRCKLAGADDTTFVEFIFEVNEIRYKFYREVKMARKNLNDVHTCLRLENGEYIPMMANPKKTTVNETAETILQLSADQFRQIIILPQGQFEKLLVSTSAQKEEILTQVFHAERWGKIVEIIKRKVKEEKDSLDILRVKIESSLEKEGVESLDALEGKILLLQDSLDTVRAEKEKAELEKKRASELYEKALEENSDFEAAEKAGNEYDKLNALKDSMKTEKDSVERAKKADTIRELYSRRNAANKEITEARTRHEAAEKHLEEVRKKEADSKLKLEKHMEKQQEIERSKSRKILMENARGTYESLDEKTQALKIARDAVKNAEAVVKAADKESKKAEEAYENCVNLRNQCMIDLQEANEKYSMSAAARLGKELIKKGGACPVCGSTEHPCIAHFDESDDEITDAELSRLNSELGDLVQKVSSADNNRNEKKKEYEEAVKKHTDSITAVAVAQAEYDNAKQNLIEDIESLKGLEEAIERIADEIENYEQTSQKLTMDKEEASRNVSVAGANLKNSEEALSKAEKEEDNLALEWNQALVKMGFVSDEEFEDSLWDKSEIADRNDAVITYNRDLEHAEKACVEAAKKIEGRIKPDMTALKENKDRTEGLVQDITKELGQKEGKLEKTKALISDVKKESELYKTKAERVNKDDEFLGKLLPKSGVSFQRYVLGVMFNSVIDAANNLLENVQGGRYRLSRTDDTSKGTNQGGLELAVFDANNGQSRSVASLSGGEKFLVALSLAIGLSTVIQAQSRGIRLEAMFIDEGFGSLDEKSLGEAVDVLSTVQSGHGLVGVISHVEKLRGILPYCIEVFHGENGNYMKV